MSNHMSHHMSNPVDEGHENTKKLEELYAYLKEQESIVVALSGGVDSSFLLEAATRALGTGKVAAVTAVSELLSRAELADAKEIAGRLGVSHEILEAHDLDAPEIVQNDQERCYYCKKRRFSALVDWAEKRGFKHVADGSNLDDAGDFRPGMRAVSELRPVVISPLETCQWSKEEIRAQAKRWGLPVWSKPSAACLASRVAYGVPLTKERLSAIEQAEHAMRLYVSGQLRIRDHGGGLARIEVEEGEMDTVFRHREELTKRVRDAGFTYVSLDLSGYRMGSQNESLKG